MDIHILHTNDVHSELPAFARLAAQLLAMRDRLRSDGHPVLTFDLGDHIDRSNPLSEGTAGFVNADVLKAVGYDGWVLGNNETVTVERGLWEQLAERADTPLFCSNLPDLRCPPNVPRGVVFQFGDVRLGVFGVTIRYEKLMKTLGVAVDDPIARVREMAAELRTRGADAIVLLSHLGLFLDRQIASCDLGVDVILGSHTHHFLEVGENVGRTWIFQAGLHARAFGHTKLTVKRGGGVEAVVWEIVHRDETAKPDISVSRAMAAATPTASQWLKEPVAWMERPLNHSLLGESEMANLLCDEMRRESKTQLAMVSGGIVNASCAAGVVRRRDVLLACPTPMRFVQMTVRGETLLRVIEEGINPAVVGKQGLGFGFRGFYVGRLHVSGAIIDTEREDSDEGPRERVVRVKVAGEDLVLGRDYRVAIAEFTALSPMFSTLRGIEFAYGRETLRSLLERALKSPENVERARVRRYCGAR